jgi:hypothetical protein
MGYESDHRKKLPPVLRGLLRGGVGSSSGSIDPIAEGRPAGAGGDVRDVPVLNLHGHLGQVSRYIQSAPAVSRSVSLPPIESANRSNNQHRHGASVDSSVGSGGATAPSLSSGADLGGGDQTAVLTSQTPKTKQPRLHRFGRPSMATGASSILQQSFANAVRNHPDEINAALGDSSH